MIMPCDHVTARAALVDAGVDRCWSLPYAHKGGMASSLNRWMAETFARDALVIPGGTLHPDDDVARVLDEALGELRLPLLKLHCSVGRFSADDRRLDPLWQRVSRDGVPVVVHTGHAEDGTTTAVELAPIARVAERFPDARVIIAHCGAPAVDAALAIVRGTRNVHADLTPVIYTPVPLHARALDGIERRILFGSDAPNTGVPIADAIAHVRALGLSRDAEQAILGGNARALVAV